MSGAHLSFTSSFTPELAWRAWFIMSYTNDNCEQAGRRAVREAGGCSAGPAPSPKRATEPGRGQGEEAGGRQARGYGVGGRVQLGAEKPGPPPTLPAGSCKGRLPLHRSEGRRGGQSLHLSPASRAPAEPGRAPAPRRHLNPPHSVFNGRRRGRHLLVHHGPKLLLTHIQALGLQLLGKRARRSQRGGHPIGVWERLGQPQAGWWGCCPHPVSSAHEHWFGPNEREVRRNWGPEPQPGVVTPPDPSPCSVPRLQPSPGPAAGRPAGGPAPGRAGPGAQSPAPAAAP